MHMTRETDYALAILRCLAVRGERTDAASIASSVSVPPRFTLKILRKLVLKGLVKSYKGSRGGYVLAQPPEKITFRDAIEAIDGPIAVNRCISGFSCLRVDSREVADCAVHLKLYRVNALLVQALDNIKIADVME